MVTGFIASNTEGKTTTLGRGGSDYTAAILGNALQCDEIEIWTNVDGFLSADPRIVKDAYSLEELTYQEAMELCYFGAKVVYPPTLIPAVAAEIPMWVKNTFNPNHIGTRIYKEKSKDSGIPIKGISSINDVCLVNIEDSRMVGMKGLSASLFSALGHAEVNVIMITQGSSEHSISLVVSSQDVQKTEDTIYQEFDIEIRDQKIEKRQLEHQLSIIALVGEKLKNTPGMSGKMFSALGKSGVNIRAIAQGSSERNISIVISRQHLEKALNMLHDTFFLSTVKTFHIFCAGTGNIGKELLLQLEKTKQYLRDQYRIQINIMGIINSRKMIIPKKETIDFSSWKEQLAQATTANMNEFIHQAIQLQLPNMVFVDNTSSKDVVEVYEKLFMNNISVVTCNKIRN
ncbi:MAG: aspartate kinase [Chitinophagaceae bacterium]